MSTIILPRPAESRPDGQRGIRAAVTLVVAGWFLLVVSLGAAGIFVGPPGKPPLAIAMGIAVPLLLFLACLRLSQSFRELVLSVDLRLIAGIQAWRWAGLGFLFLYAYNVLPAPFALTAGLGDMAIGATAPWIILSLSRRPGFAASGTFIRWNLLGILDLVTAVSIATVTAMLASGAPREINTTPMATLPLLVIPAFLVPLFLMLHIAALMQSRQLSRRTV